MLYVRSVLLCGVLSVALTLPEGAENNEISQLDLSKKPETLRPEKTVEWWGKVYAPKTTPHSECEQQVEQYLTDLRHFELWAMQMYDATGKPAAGLLSGNSYQLGDFDSCLAIGSSAQGSVQGKYCLAEIDLETTSVALPSIKAAVNRLEAGAVIRSKHTDQTYAGMTWTTLQWGLCVPAACNESDAEAGLRHFLHDYQLPGVTVDLVVKPGMCYTSQRNQKLPFITLVILGFLGGMLLLAIVATIIDSMGYYPEQENLKTKERALLAFSLRRTWSSLISREESELPVLHGVRSVFAVMVVVCHKILPMVAQPYSNRGLLAQIFQSPFSAIARGGMVHTDAFIQLSGVLNAYSMGREIKRSGSINWRRRVLIRIIRLTPAMLAVVLFYAYALEHLGAGPRWGYIVTPHADACKANFWHNLLYIQNFDNVGDMCAPHTYQLALDMQLFLIAPVVVYCLHYWPLCSVGVLGVCQLAVASMRYFTTLRYNISDFMYHGISLVEMKRTVDYTYSKPMYRLTPYFVGLLTGFFFEKAGKVHFTKAQTVAGWTLCALLATLSVFYQSHLTQADAVYDKYDAAWFSAWWPITWSAALAWLIIACSSGYGGWLHKFLCQHWLVVFSRLSYAIYLTQFIVFVYEIGSVRSSQEFSPFYLVDVYEVLGILLSALSFTLLFDLPMQEIKSILLPGRKSRKSD